MIDEKWASSEYKDQNDEVESNAGNSSMIQSTLCSF
jgi:hypothetical protein